MNGYVRVRFMPETRVAFRGSLLVEVTSPGHAERLIPQTGTGK